MFGGNFAPRGWAFCEGQLLSISSHTALFSILGTTYGGDGRSTFGLPDIRGRVSMHHGHGPSLSDRRLGAKGGNENVQLTTNNIPSHSHHLPILTKGNQPTGDNAGVAQAADNDSSGTESQSSTESSGSSQPIDNMQPFMVVSYIIALEGVYPSRS